MGPQGSGIFSPHSSLTPARDTHLGPTLLIMDCSEAIASPEQTGLGAELGRGSRISQDVVCLLFPPAEGHYFGKQSFYQ